MRLFARIAASLFLPVFIVPAATAQQWSIQRFSDDVKPLISSAAQANPKPGADVVVLDDEESYVFDSDGRATRTRYVVYKVLTQKGADDWDNVGVTWEPWHEEKPVLHARVIAGDQSVHNLDPSTVTDSPAKDGEDNVYGDRRVARAPLPAIAPGATVEEQDSMRETPVISGTGIVRRAYFGRSVPVERSHLEIDVPASLPLQYSQALLPNVKPQRTETADRVRVTFDSGPMEPLEDAPPRLPSDIAAYPEITFSTGKSWVQLADAYDKIVNDRIAGADLKPLVLKLTSGKQSRDDKMQAMLQYLSREIRYTGVEFDEAAIVPRSPTEVLTRKYGDCKDKAVLLVAMLRSAGIPAYVALLDSGEREDVPASLPGTGLFDHAIVFVPGPPDTWIDATDQYARLRALSSVDQGRYALVARAGNDALQRIPVASAEENLLTEKREIRLAENGPARVVEISQPHGALESFYREDYGDKQNKDAKDNLANYVKNVYLADNLDAIDRSDATDLSKPFELTLTCNRAKRGATDLNSAAAAIRLESIFDRLPSELQNRDSDDNTNSNSGAEKKKRVADFQLPEPFITEWEYKIVPPEGFQPKPLPKDAKISLGPALLSEQFSSDKDNTVYATIRFEIAKARLSAAEGLDMRDRVAQVKDGQAILIYFEPVAQALLSNGKAREAFQSYRDLITAHPKSPIYHLRRAEALLSLGLGDAARQEARRAVTLEPTSALAQETLADIFEYDLVGRKFRRGSDYDGAAAAFRAAEKLDPDDKTIVGNLAILLEYNKWGLRYGPGATLDEAVAEYRRLTPQELENMGLKNNLAFALFYDAKFSEALNSATALNPPLNSLIVACEAVLNGSQEGLAEARKRTATDDQFRDVVGNAGGMLKHIRKYRLAADFIAAGASGNRASTDLAVASVYRNAELHEKMAFPDNPSGLALHYYALEVSLDVTLDQLSSVSSRNGKIALATPDTVEAYAKRERSTLSYQSRTADFRDVEIDYAIANAQPISQGNDTTGYKVTLWPSYRDKSAIYVVKEEGRYRVLATGTRPYGVALEVLDRIGNQDLAAARTLLDWVREDWRLTGGDDRLEGDAFPRLWVKGKDADANSMNIAAAAILAKSKNTAKRGISILEAAKPPITDETENVGISLALIDGYTLLEQHEKALAVSTDLANRYPDSRRAFLYECELLRALGRVKEAQALAQERLKRIPDDLDAKRTLMFNAIAQDDHIVAHQLATEIAKSSGAESSDFNEAAWESLFTGTTNKDDLADAVKGDQSSPNSFPQLHTLGCVYAELGRAKEARDALIQAMDSNNYDELEPNTWYAFGRIAEQIGDVNLATADYSRVEKPAKAISIPGSSYELAQIHIKALAHVGVQVEPAPAKQSPQ